MSDPFFGSVSFGLELTVTIESLMAHAISLESTATQHAQGGASSTPLSGRVITSMDSNDPPVSSEISK